MLQTFKSAVDVRYAMTAKVELRRNKLANCSALDSRTNSSRHVSRTHSRNIRYCDCPMTFCNGSANAAWSSRCATSSTASRMEICNIASLTARGNTSSDNNNSRFTTACRFFVAPKPAPNTALLDICFANSFATSMSDAFCDN